MRISDWSSDVCSSDLRDPLAKQTARPQDQDQEHEQVHRDFGRRRKEIDGEPAYGPDQDSSDNHAPERAESADHHDDEGGNEDVVAHGGIDRKSTRLNYSH